MKEIRYWMAYIYQKNHNAFLIHLYGAYSDFLETDWWPGRSVPAKKFSYEIHLEKFLKINSVESPCYQGNKNIDLEGCLQKYMEMQVNCTLPRGNINSEIADLCKTEDEFQQYHKLAKTVKFWGERRIYEKTGCKSNCHVHKYTMKERYAVKNYSGTDEV